MNIVFYRAVTFVLILCVFGSLFLAPGCQRKSKTQGEATTGRFKSPDAFREYLRDRIICPTDGLTINQCAKFNPDCPSGKKIMAVIDRMIKEGWGQKDIEDAVSLFAQGRPVPIETVANSQPCPGPGGNLRLDFFIMSQCPYGFRFIDGALSEMLRDFGGVLDWEPHFILSHDGGKFSSLHGQPEVDEDTRQVCIYKTWGKDKWLIYVRCYEKGWLPCAQRQGQATPAEMAQCYLNAANACVKESKIPEGELDVCMKTRAEDFLLQDIALSGKYGANGSPTAVYNCQKKVGGAYPLVFVKPYICELFPPDKLPSACPK